MKNRRLLSLVADVRGWLLPLVIAALFAATPILGQSRACASIILSEIMYDVQGSDTNREWVEIFNTGASSIDLSGWQFGRPNVNQWTSAFPLGTTLGANQAMVITPSASTFDSDWGSGKNRIQVGSFPTLPNDPGVGEGRIAVRNNLGVIQDEISYRNPNGWPNNNGNDGHSIYLLPQHLNATANNSGGNWRPSSQGVYGAYYRAAGGESENHASPGFVATQQQDPFTPSPDAVWSMVVLPDTQNYVARDQSQFNILKGQTQWIADNKDAFNIQLVLQEGDIVNRNSGTASNGVTAVQQWERAREAFSTLNGVVPYIMATGNHDYGITNSQTRDTKFNTYFKATDNPLVNPATGGILKGVMTPGELQNAYYEVTGPDGRDMLVFSLEFWPRNNVVNWAKGIAELPQYADHTAVLLTHSYLNSGGSYWNTGAEAYEMEGGNDGTDLWNKLVKVAGNFEMTFNGHVGGDGVAYRVDESNSGDDVHQMLLNSQFETNAGNGWMRVLEFLEDGQTVRVRTYSPHFDLYRTNSANQYNITLSHLEAALVWNTGAAAVSEGFARGNGDLGVGVNGVDPFGAGGKEDLLIGFNGVATRSGSSNVTVGSIAVGTGDANSIIAGRNGDGTLNVNGSGGVIVSSSTSTGDLTIGEGGYTGTVNWNASGTLDVQGKLRIGQTGVGVLNQSAGTVIAGNTNGSFKFAGIGVGSGSNGTYNLDGGTFLPGGGIPGAQDRQVLVGENGGVGDLNIGDGSGPAGSARVETDDDIFVGRDGGAGQITVSADGLLKMSGNGGPLIVGSGSGGIGAVVQTGGQATIDGELQIGVSAGAIGMYTISGGTLTTAADGNSVLAIGRSGGDGRLRVEGTGSVLHRAEAFVGEGANSGAEGRLEIIGSTASVTLGQLANAPGGVNGVSETMFWQADAAGITPLVITGDGALTSNFVQLQDPSEASANLGVGATLAGDGIALELDLSAIIGDAALTLIDNQTAEPITGFFEHGTTLDLFEEGALVAGTGYAGTVNISYTGGDGNDVVLNLVAGSASSGDFDNDGDVDGRDLLAWQRGLGATGASRGQGDANGDGVVSAEDLVIWREQFGSSAAAAATGAVPEPSALAMSITALGIGIASFGRRWMAA